MSIKFRCQQCNARLSIKSSKAGTTIVCPKCECKQIVPELELSESAAKAKAPRREKTASGSASESSSVEQPAQQLDIDENDEVSIYEEFAVYDEPDLVYDGKEYRAAARVTVDFDRLAVPRYVIYLQGALLGLASLFFFSLGWWIGHAGSVNRANVVNSGCVVSGSIYYETSEGKMTDEGAVVMFLPAERRPMRKPVAKDLMPGNVLTSQNNSVQIIRELGGDIGSVSRDGRFEMKLDTNRKYYMCVLSKNNAVPSQEDVPISVRAEVGAYFQPIATLVDNQNFHWETVQVSGKSKQLEDVVF